MRLHFIKFLLSLSFFYGFLITDLSANPSKKDQFFDSSINLLAVLNETPPYRSNYNLDIRIQMFKI